MKVPIEVQKMWEQLKQQGDIEAIAKASRYHRNTIGAALEQGKCTMDVFAAIQSFYNKRQSELTGLVNPDKAA